MGKHARTSPSKKIRQAKGKSSKATRVSSVHSMEMRVISLAEKLGRIAGTAQAKTDIWLNEPEFRNQLGRIRDGATTLMGKVTRIRAKRKNRAKKPAPQSRSGGKVDAPGKKHRRPPPSVPGAKHSDQRIAKVIAARQTKKTRRQG